MRPAVKALVVDRSDGQLIVRLPSGQRVQCPDAGKFEFGDRVMVLYDRNEDKVISVEAPDMHIETLTDDIPEPEDEPLEEYAPEDDFFLD